jgi:tetratricopeptide (TPR) repeat protein
LSGFIQNLLPDSLRALNLMEAGQAQRLLNPAAALNFFQRGYALEPDSLSILTELARLRATARTETVRNGPEAVNYALQAFQKDPAHSHEITDVLACAYATNGQFDLAEKYETQAMQQAENMHADTSLLAAYRARLDLFRSKQLFHD